MAYGSRLSERRRATMRHYALLCLRESEARPAPQPRDERSQQWVELRSREDGGRPLEQQREQRRHALGGALVGLTREQSLQRL